MLKEINNYYNRGTTNDEHIIMAQQVGGPGVTPIDPENITNQTLWSYPTEDKNMSTGLEENE
jgi:hypothetical protein